MTTTHRIRIRIQRSRKPAEPTPPPPISPDVIERDDGQYQIGLGEDAAGPFETRAFAQAVAAKFEFRAPLC